MLQARESGLGRELSAVLGVLVVVPQGLVEQPRVGVQVASRKLVSQLSAVDAPYATWSYFPVVVVGLVVSSAIEASLR